MKKVLLIFALAVLLRIWHLPETAQFSYDEARDAMAEKSILNGKLTLLGPESQIGSKTIYFGPLYYYLMAPALKFSNYNPLGPYFLTAIIGGLTAALLAYFFSPAAGFFYAVFPMAVIYNRWAWNPNTIPFFITIALIFALKKRFFWVGLFAGLATQLHWSVGLFILPFILKPKAILGFIIGLLPIIIFDIRYNFLYTRSLIELFSGSISRGLTWHYFLWLIPVVAIKLPKKVLLVLVIVSAILIKMPQSVDALNPFYVKQMAKIISYDQMEKPELNFNVVSFYGGDFKATNIRYFLEAKPLGIAEYDVADHLYVVAPEQPMYNGLWEIRSFTPKRISKTWEIAGTKIYRLEKL